MHRKRPPRNTTVPGTINSPAYTDPECHVQYTTDGRHYDAKSPLYCEKLRLAKNRVQCDNHVNNAHSTDAQPLAKRRLLFEEAASED